MPFIRKETRTRGEWRKMKERHVGHVVVVVSDTNFGRCALVTDRNAEMQEICRKNEMNEMTRKKRENEIETLWCDDDESLLPFWLLDEMMKMNKFFFLLFIPVTYFLTHFRPQNRTEQNRCYQKRKDIPLFSSFFMSKRCGHHSLIQKLIQDPRHSSEGKDGTRCNKIKWCLPVSLSTTGLNVRAIRWLSIDWIAVVTKRHRFASMRSDNRLIDANRQLAPNFPYKRKCKHEKLNPRIFN